MALRDMGSSKSPQMPLKGTKPGRSFYSLGMVDSGKRSKMGCAPLVPRDFCCLESLLVKVGEGLAFLEEEGGPSLI